MRHPHAARPHPRHSVSVRPRFTIAPTAEDHRDSRDGQVDTCAGRTRSGPCPHPWASTPLSTRSGGSKSSRRRPGEHSPSHTWRSPPTSAPDAAQSHCQHRPARPTGRLALRLLVCGQVTASAPAVAQPRTDLSRRPLAVVLFAGPSAEAPTCGQQVGLRPRAHPPAVSRPFSWALRTGGCALTR